MPIDIGDRYKLIFEEHQYASDFRVKIFRGWCLMYAALAAVFVWVQNTSKSLSWLITAAGIAITILMWVADVRNRSGIRASKDIGEAIERDPQGGIKQDQRFFARIQAEGFVERLLTHSRAIDAYSVVVILALLAATIYLFVKKGVLPP